MFQSNGSGYQGRNDAAPLFATDMINDIGDIGVWRPVSLVNIELATELERLGYGALWLGSSPAADLAVAEELLDATSTLVVGTSIVNVWAADAATVAASYHRIAAKHPGRFLLGIGIGHPEATAAYQKPYDKLVSYLDELDAAGVPEEGRAIAALGPKVLELAGARSAGALPYLTVPAHTRQAREKLGEGTLLAVEQKVVLNTDPARARAIGRSGTTFYFGLRNYRNSLLRLGFTEDDLAGEGSDRLVDALAPHGDAAAVAGSVRAHLDAGADHVAVQVLTSNDDTELIPAYRALAQALRS